jgi:signal peptidase I
MFRLAEGQYMPMGDNSPASSDARVWSGAPYVEEALLLGRALFIYWPHSLNKPIPYFPNFQRMGPIK